MSVMAESEGAGPGAALGLRDAAAEAPRNVGVAAQLALTLLLVACATLLAFVVQQLISAPNLTLIFVLPVVVAATFFGWTAAVTAALTGVLAFDFFFTQPYFSLRMTSPSDIWAAALLLIIAAIVSTVAAESRRRALEARRGAQKAEALQALAHAVIEERPRRDVTQAAATALQRVFRAPAVVFVEDGGAFAPEAVAGGAEITDAVKEAAAGVLASQVHARGETYPYDRSPFDLWPVATPSGRRLVLGVNFAAAEEQRPPRPERFVDVVGGYVAVAVGGRG